MIYTYICTAILGAYIIFIFINISMLYSWKRGFKAGLMQKEKCDDLLYELRNEICRLKLILESKGGTYE